MLSFDDEDDEVINFVLSVLETGRYSYKIEETKRFSEVQFQNLKISFDRRELTKCGTKVKLTFTEFEILQLLIQNPGKVFSKEQIYDIVWKEPYDGDYNIVTSHIRHIREKIEDDPADPIYIQTVWGVGYRFNPEVDR